MAGADDESKKVVQEQDAEKSGQVEFDPKVHPLAVSLEEPGSVKEMFKLHVALVKSHNELAVKVQLLTAAVSKMMAAKAQGKSKDKEPAKDTAKETAKVAS